MTTVFRSVTFPGIVPVLWDATGQLVGCMLALYDISTFSVVLLILKYLRNHDFLFALSNETVVMPLPFSFNGTWVRLFARTSPYLVVCEMWGRVGFLFQYR